MLTVFVALISAVDLREKRVAAGLGDLRTLLSTRDNAPAMRMVLAKHVKEIVMLPGQEAGEIKHKGNGICRVTAAEGSVPRAGIAPNCLLRCGL